jgi:hypothetical protein
MKAAVYYTFNGAIEIKQVDDVEWFNRDEKLIPEQSGSDLEK